MTYTLTKYSLFILSISFLATFATVNIIYDMHTDQNWGEIISASQGVLTGYPHWRAFQNRLLMPGIINLMESVSNPEIALLFIYCIGIFIHNIILVTIFLKLFGYFCSIFALLLWCSGFILYQDYWLYPWDIFDLSVFLIIWYALYTKSNAKTLLVIFPFALLNRESALFLPIAYWLIQTDLNKIDVNKIWLIFWTPVTLITGSLLIFGVVWTKFIRDYLFIGSSFGGLDLDNSLIGNHIYLYENLTNILYFNWISNILPINLITCFYITLALKSILDSKALMPRITSLYWLFLLTNIVIFGIFNETRMHFILFGFYLFHVISYIKKYHLIKES